MSTVLLGLLLGCVFGVAAQMGAFCLLRGLKGIGPGRDRSALQAFALAMGVAIIGVQGAAVAGLIPLRETLPLVAAISWLSALVGGAIFGLGMAMANACGARSLVLLGQGNLRSLIVLVFMALAAQATLTGALSGLLQTFRKLLAGSQAGSLPDLLHAAKWPQTVIVVSIAALAAALIWYARPLIRTRSREAALAAVVGLCVIAGWAITHATNDPFDPKPLTSISYVAPLGDSFLWLMLSTGRAASFGVAVVAGTLVGAFASALASGSFQPRAVGTPRQTTFAAVGGVLMGFGGVMALGCSIGQGLSGVSTLSLNSFAAFGGICMGALAGLALFPNVMTGEST